MKETESLIEAAKAVSWKLLILNRNTIVGYVVEKKPLMIK